MSTNKTYTATIKTKGMEPTVAKLHTIRIYEPTFNLLKGMKYEKENWDNFLRKRFKLPKLTVIPPKTKPRIKSVVIQTDTTQEYVTRSDDNTTPPTENIPDSGDDWA